MLYIDNRQREILTKRGDKMKYKISENCKSNFGWPENVTEVTLKTKSGIELDGLKNDDKVYVILPDQDPEWSEITRIAPCGKIINNQVIFENKIDIKRILIEGLNFSYEKASNLKGKIAIDLN